MLDSVLHHTWRSCSFIPIALTSLAWTSHFYHQAQERPQLQPTYKCHVKNVVWFLAIFESYLQQQGWEQHIQAC